jgi:Leucine-rich repeat (LRR) protein
MTPCAQVVAIRAADYRAIASAAPWLTKLSLKLPVSATALPQQMAALLAACTKLEDLALHSDYQAELLDIIALAAGTQLLRLSLTGCPHLDNLAPLSALVKLQSLDISSCESVYDLAPLATLVNLQSLDMSACANLTDLAPLGALVNMRSLNMCDSPEVSDVAPLATLVNLQSLDMSNCHYVTDLAPLAALVNMQTLDINSSWLSLLTSSGLTFHLWQRWSTC